MDFLAWISCLCLLWGLSQALSLIVKGSRRSPSNLPPGPPPLPVIGNLLELGNLPHKSLAKLARTYGPIIKLQLGFVTTVVISSPTLAKEILQSHDAIFANRTTPDAITAHDHHQLGLPWIPVDTSDVILVDKIIDNVRLVNAQAIHHNCNKLLNKSPLHQEDIEWGKLLSS